MKNPTPFPDKPRLVLIGIALLCLLHTPVQSQTGSVAPLPAVPKFYEETDTAGLQSRFEGEDEYMVGGGVATFDCDGSGLPAVYVTAGVNKAKFYRNRSTRGGPIKLQEERSGLEVTNAVGAYPLDMDGDGNTDLVVLRVGEVEVFRGLGSCKFERANDRWNVRSGNGWHTAFSATWEQGQNWPTLAIGTYTDRTKPEFPWGSCTPGLLLRPNPAGKGFADAQPLVPGHCALSMLFSDWGRTGEAALRVSNDREYYKNGQEQLWKLKPGQAPQLYGPEQGWKPLQIWGMGIASYDLDGDGRPLVFLTSMADNKLQKLDAGATGPSYSDVAFKRGATAHRPTWGGDIHPSTAWHAQFADANNDALADLFIVKGNVSTMPAFAMLDPNNLLLQRADGSFTDVGQQAGMASVKRGRGGMMVDLNADGWLDMVVVNRWDKAQLWRNLGTGGSTNSGADAAQASTGSAPTGVGQWLQLRLRQSGGNRDAIGAWVEVDTGNRVIRQELTVGGGHASGHLGWMHVGLGALTSAAPSSAGSVRMRVQWPHGPWSEWQTVQANQFYLFDKDQGVSLVKIPCWPFFICICI